MKGKFAFIVGASLGYVLGSRAGRERYEQIRRGAQRLWKTAPVQKGVHVVRGAVDDGADDLKVVARRFGSQLLNKVAEQASAKADQDRAKKDKAAKVAKAAKAAKTTKTDGAAAKPSTPAAKPSSSDPGKEDSSS